MQQVESRKVPGKRKQAWELVQQGKKGRLPSGEEGSAQSPVGMARNLDSELEVRLRGRVLAYHAQELDLTPAPQDSGLDSKWSGQSSKGVQQCGANRAVS